MRAIAQHQYADEQLANLQKRICLIEFLHLGLIIVYQGNVWVRIFAIFYKQKFGLGAFL